MKIPDAIAPIVGYRTWAMGLGQLWSAHGPGRVRWPRTEPLLATCLKHGALSCFNRRLPAHHAPDQLCTCGIYGVFAPWDLEVSEPRDPWTLVIGRVEGWGRVVLGEKGFRVELARPVELFVETWWDERTQRSASRLAAAYGVSIPAWEVTSAHRTLHGRAPRPERLHQGDAHQ
jgi:hypothetical protein